MPDVTMLSDVSLWCRSERHLWMWERDTLDGDTFDRHLMCDRCGLTKTKTISLRTWQVIKTRTGKYPAGYLATGGGRVQMPDVYRVQFQRAKKVMSR